jgi:hypothetical protein
VDWITDVSGAYVHQALSAISQWTTGYGYFWWLHAETTNQVKQEIRVRSGRDDKGKGFCALKTSYRIKSSTPVWQQNLETAVSGYEPHVALRQRKSHQSIIEFA